MDVPFVDLRTLHQPLQPDLVRITQGLISSGIVMGGDVVPSFESAFAQYIGVNHCIACANGTDALEIILRAMNVGPGNEVIVPANGWLSAAEAVRLVGATPVYVDNDAATYNINSNLVEASITHRTRAIIPIHLYGRPADLPSLLDIAERNGLYLIEDAAQAHGADIAGRKVGSWGHAAAFSFYPTKNLGALGDAGAITTNDAELAKRVRSIAEHGQLVRNYPIRLGRNSRMDNFQAAILSLKLPHLEEWNHQRREIARHYCRKLQDAGAILPAPFAEGQEVHHLFVIRVDKRDRLRTILEESGITTAVHYPQTVVDMMERERSQSAIAAPVAHQQASQLLSLPIYPNLQEEPIDFVANAIRRALSSV